MHKQKRYLEKNGGSFYRGHITIIKLIFFSVTLYRTVKLNSTGKGEVGYRKLIQKSI